MRKGIVRYREKKESGLKWLLSGFLGLLIAISQPVFGELGSPIQGVYRQDLYNNSLGLNSKSSPTNLADGESSGLLNIYFDKHGAILKRKGYTTYLSTQPFATSETVYGLYQFTNAANTSYNIAIGGNSIKYVSGGTWTTASGSLTGTYPFDIDTGDDYVIFTNNVDRVQYWNGVGNTQDLIPFAGFEKAKCLAYHQGYLFLANVEVSSVRYPSRIYYSTQGDITTWSANYILEPNENDGQPIVGLGVSYDDLIIFKSDSIWKLSPGGGGLSPKNWSLTKVSSDIGCIARDSIINIDNEIIFLSRKGVYGWTGSRVTPLSDNIQPEIDKINKNRYDYIVGGHIPELNQYWLSVPIESDTTNTRVYVYDYKIGAWTIYDGINASYLATWLISGAPTLMSGNYTGYTFKQNTGNTDNSAAINAYYDTKWFNFGDPVHRKSFRRLTAIAKAEGDYDIDLYTYLDFKGTGVVASPPDVTVSPLSLDNGSAKWGTAIWGQFNWGTGGEIVREKNLNLSGYWIKYRFANPRANEPFTLYGFSQESEVIR